MQKSLVRRWTGGILEVTTMLSLALALESRYRKAGRITLRTLRQGLGRPIFGKVIAIGLTLCLLNLDLAVALEAKRVLEPIAPKRVAPPALPKPSFLASLNTMLSQITAVQEQPPVAPAPGLPPAWGASAGVYGGVVNLGNGNLTLQLPLVGWADGVGCVLFFNSQANPSQPSPIAPKWTHNWHVSLTLNSSQTQAILQEGDGSRWVYTDADGYGNEVSARRRISQPCVIRYPGGYRYYYIDSGDILNPTEEFKILYTAELCSPDPEGTPRLISFDGTLLGIGSFVRLRDPRRPDWSEDWYSVPGRRSNVPVEVDGNCIIVELWRAPSTSNRLRINYVHWAKFSSPLIEPADNCGICCGMDDRIPSSAPFVGRLVLRGDGGEWYCTAFLAGYPYNNCIRLFSAGHCLSGTSIEDSQIEFFVPPSVWVGDRCVPRSPSREHIFELRDWRYEDNGPGNDWAVILPSTNNEGLTPYQKYSDYRVIETDIGEHLLWNIVHRFGYGSDDKPWQCQRHLTQQYTDGRIVAISYSAPYTIDFSADIRPGDSGGPVILRDSLAAVGIITHCRPGCPNIAQRLDDYDIITAYWELCRCFGDVNGDRMVDDLDLLSVLYAFGTTCWGCPEDQNGDGIVDDADMLIVLLNFGTPCD